jgi:hypothetical protein
MRVSGRGKETFLFVNGLGVARSIRLGQNVELLPARCSPSPDDIIQVSQTEIDLGIATIFLRQVSSQIRVIADNPKDLAVRAWNSVWDAVLLSALCGCDAVCNFQCNTSAENFGSDSQLEVTNYHLRGLSEEVHTINDTEALWIEQNFSKARALLDKAAFQNAVHSLASYRWNAHPRVRLAILWSGIEGLFEVESELVFRISLYSARFLAPNDEAERARTFANVKRLYKLRSAAVHGSKIKGKSGNGVEESAQLLLKLIRQCIVSNDLPHIEYLAP